MKNKIFPARKLRKSVVSLSIKTEETKGFKTHKFVEMDMDALVSCAQFNGGMYTLELQNKGITVIFSFRLADV